MAFTFLENLKNKFDQSKLGIATNTLLGIPKATVGVGKEIGQSIARNIGSAGVTVGGYLGGSEELAYNNVKSTFGQELWKNVFGTAPIRSIEDRIADAELKIKYNPVAQKTGLSKAALPLAFAGIMGSVGLDLTPFGGLEKNAVKSIRRASKLDDAFVIAKQLGADDDVAKMIAPVFMETKNTKQANYALDLFKSMKGTKKLATGVADEVSPKLSSEVASLQELADQSLREANRASDVGAFSLPKMIDNFQTPVKQKVNLLDYVRTPDRVLKKIGLEKEFKLIRKQYEGYLKELPENIDKITAWADQLPKESSKRLFQWLDGRPVQLNAKELKIGGEIKQWLSEWADRLELPKDDRIAEYITHIFDEQLIQKEFDEDLAKIIVDKIPESVYNPFLQKRLGAKGYVEDTWRALDAYVKRATRKVHMDPALAKLEEASGGLELSQWNYVKSFADRINMRPTEVDNLLDNAVKSVVGYRLGQRPVNRVSKLLRQMTYRAMLGLNLSSALKNLSQGINTYAKLGEKYTTLGYLKLLQPGARAEIARSGILMENFIQDRTLSAGKKLLQKADKGLFFFFENAERINRGSAYFGAKSKALAKGMPEEEAIEFAKQLVRDTQFAFGSIDTPIVLQSDIGKTLGQFQSFTVKQIEFLTEMAKNKEFVGLLRYAMSGMLFIYTIGKAFGMEQKDLVPAWRIGTPPSLQLPIETGKAILDAPNKFGQKRTVGEKVKDVGKAGLGLIPAGIQGRKTIQGIQAVQQGESQTASGRKRFDVGGTIPKDLQAILFGQYANEEAREYFENLEKKNSTKKTNMTF